MEEKIVAFICIRRSVGTMCSHESSTRSLPMVVPLGVLIAERHAQRGFPKGRQFIAAPLPSNMRMVALRSARVGCGQPLTAIRPLERESRVGNGFMVCRTRRIAGMSPCRQRSLCLSLAKRPGANCPRLCRATEPTLVYVDELLYCRRRFRARGCIGRGDSARGSEPPDGRKWEK